MVAGERGKRGAVLCVQITLLLQFIKFLPTEAPGIANCQQSVQGIGFAL